MKKIDWCCLISQTGNEMMQICYKHKILPEKVITNNIGKMSDEVRQFLRVNEIVIVELPFNPKWEHYQQIKFNNLVTLHGYLRILPKEYFSLTCSWSTFNGHPGLITEYPELKGKDPQRRAFEAKMLCVGSVVHKVTEKVDEGKVMEESRMYVPHNAAVEVYFSSCKKTSQRAWDKFFTELLEPKE